MKECRKCKELKSLTDFHKDVSMKDGKRSYCKPCSISISLAANKKRYIINHEKLREYEGGEFICSKCSFSYKNYAPFEYHHIDRASKEFMIGEKMWVSKFENWSQELDKCTLLCVNCHRIEHFDDNVFTEFVKEKVQ